MPDVNNRPNSTTKIPVQRFSNGRLRLRQDWVASEEPLEIRLLQHTPQGVDTTSVSITMRTPGHDFELCAGFLFGEGILTTSKDLDMMSYCVEERAEQLYNIVNVQLRQGVTFDATTLTRHFYTTSSCGVCGKASLEALEVRGCQTMPQGLIVPAKLITGFPGRLKQDQRLFEQTGGLHAAGLFDVDGNLLCLREDVGRHNAVDKVIGHALLSEKLPLSDRILVLSGRASFELVQKALVARISIVVAVGAPSSLAVQLAKEFELTLLGFVNEDQFNVYSGAQRLELSRELEDAV